MSQFILITGRTREQGQALHVGKRSQDYQQATAWVEIGPQDMERLELEDGQLVRVRASDGQVEVTARRGDLPPGLLFMPMGPVANMLVGTDTQSTGMPPFKNLVVEVERV